MKNLFLVLVPLILISCNEAKNQSDLKTTNANKIDMEAELNAIEETRSAFELAIKEKRYGDLRKYAAPGLKAVSPGSEDWLEYKRIRENPMGQFSYDSIKMSPQETVVLNDSMAYDFGTSYIYYTNENGQPVQLRDTFLVILKKDENDGIWKMYREVASAVVE